MMSHHVLLKVEFLPGIHFSHYYVQVKIIIWKNLKPDLNLYKISEHVLPKCYQFRFIDKFMRIMLIFHQGDFWYRGDDGNHRANKGLKNISDAKLDLGLDLDCVVEFFLIQDIREGAGEFLEEGCLRVGGSNWPIHQTYIFFSNLRIGWKLKYSAIEGADCLGTPASAVPSNAPPVWSGWRFCQYDFKILIWILKFWHI